MTILLLFEKRIFKSLLCSEKIYDFTIHIVTYAERAIQYLH